MKTVTISLLACLALAGCASPTSPLDRPARNNVGAGQVAALALGGAAGAVAGRAITGDDTGTLVGAGVGLLGGALVNNAVSARRESALAEAEARGERRASAEMFEQMWDKEARAPGPRTGAASPASNLVSYPAGTYEGVKYAPRESTAPGFSEPRR